MRNLEGFAFWDAMKTRPELIRVQFLVEVADRAATEGEEVQWASARPDSGACPAMVGRALGLEAAVAETPPVTRRPKGSDGRLEVRVPQPL